MVSAIKITLAIALSAISMMTNADKECVVISNGSEMTFSHFKAGVFQVDITLLNESKVINPVWPSYSEFIRGVVFEAREDGRNGIFKTQTETSFKKSELITLGRYPALSPDGEKISFFNEDYSLTIKDFRSGTSILISGPYNRRSVLWRPLWINNNELVYLTEDDEVFSYTLSRNSHSMLISEKLFPVGIRNDVVFFIDANARSLFEYKRGRLNAIFNNHSLSISSGIILLKDGFLYSRQTWPNIFRLSEAKNLFYFSSESGSENELKSNFSLFGGSLIPCELTVSSK